MATFESQSEVSDRDVEQPFATEGAERDNSTTQQELQRSQRTRKLTEKGQELRDELISKATHRFSVCYEKWKFVAKDAKKALHERCSTDQMHEHVTKVTEASKNVSTAYEELRRITYPDNAMRRRIDTCEAVTKTVIKTAEECMKTKMMENDVDKETEKTNLALRSSHSKKMSINSYHTKSSIQSKVSSRHSSFCSAKRRDAAAEVAANEAALEVLLQQESHIKDIEKQEAEIAERQRALEAKRRELERLDAIKSLKAAQARQRVYDQSVCSDEDIYELLHQNSKKENEVKSENNDSYCKSCCSPQGVIHPQQEIKMQDLVKALTESISCSRLPVPEPTVFSGDALRYNDWKISFQTLIERKNIPAEEKMYYLRKYVSGPAGRAIESYFLLGTKSAYAAAWTLLEERYGNPFLISKAFRDKLDAWPKISSKSSIELQEYADFLRSCKAAMSEIKGLEVLNDCNENQRMLSKLPDWIISSWNRRVTEIQEQSQTFPSFSEFVDFLTIEAKIACNPITSLHALKPSEGEGPKMFKGRSHGTKVLKTNTSEVTSCNFCEKTGHDLQKCWEFMNTPIEERLAFVQEKKLCFGCLKSGHRSKDCETRETCDTCDRRHPTCLHDDRTKDARRQSKTNKTRSCDESIERKTDCSQIANDAPQANEATAHRILQNDEATHTSSIIPVWVSTKNEPEHEVLVYALLDTQSDTTFILEETAKALHATSKPVQLKLTTMSTRNAVVSCHKLSGLQVRGFYSNKLIPLPVTYSRTFIPANVDHIPTPKTARVWPHLEHIANEIAPLQSCDVGLLIGYNCSQALVPRQVLSGKENQPFGLKTDLGWSIVGFGNTCLDYGDDIGLSHRIIVKQVMPSIKSSSNLKSEVHYVNKTQTKEMVSPADVIEVLESDFVEKVSEDIKTSQEDIRFMMKLKESIKHQDNGHDEMPLPFKTEKPDLRNNKECAIDQLRCLERKPRRNKQHYVDYKKFMEKIKAHGDAEENPAANASRGLTAIELITSKWFTGPDLLWQKVLSSGEIKVGETSVSDPEVKKVSVLNTQGNEQWSLPDNLQRFPDWFRMITAVARPKRFRKNAKNIRGSNQSLKRSNAIRTKAKTKKHYHKRTHHQVQGITTNAICAFIAIPYLWKRRRRVQVLANTFWTRWRRKYVLNLQSRPNWTKECRDAKVNHIVLLQDDSSPRNQWKLAKTVEVYPGHDGRVRKVKLLVSDSTLDGSGKPKSKPIYLERPIQRTVTLLEAE